MTVLPPEPPVDAAATDGAPAPSVDRVPEGATRCPLCGADNRCGIAAGQSSCWCFSISIPPEVLEGVPPDQRGNTCICQRCAEQAAAAANE